MNRFVQNTKQFLKPRHISRVMGNRFQSTQQSNMYFNFDSKQIAEIRNFPIRAYKTRFGQNYSPHYWKIKDNAYGKLWKDVEKEHEKRADNCFTGLIMDLGNAFFFPLVKNEQKLITIIEIMCCLFLLDDYIGLKNRKEDFEDLCDTIVGKKAPEKPYEHMINGIHKAVRQCYTDAQYNRYIDSLYKYLYDCSNELESSGKNLNSMQEMVDFRDNVIGCRPFLNLVPFSLDIDVTDYLNDENLLRMESLIVKHVTLLNDLFSMKKELAQRHDINAFNALIFHYNKYNSLDKTMDTVHQILDSYECEFFQLKGVMQSRYPHSEQLHQYIQGIEHFGGGNAIWEQFAPRYNRYNGFSLKDEIFAEKFTEMIPVVEYYTAQYNVEKELV